MNDDECQHLNFDEASGRCADCGRRPAWMVKIEPVPLAMILVGFLLIFVGYVMFLQGL